MKFYKSSNNFINLKDINKFKFVFYQVIQKKCKNVIGKKYWNIFKLLYIFKILYKILFLSL